MPSALILIKILRVFDGDGGRVFAVVNSKDSVDGERVFSVDGERVYLGTAKSSMVFERSEKKDSTCQCEDDKHHCRLSLFLDAIAYTPTYLCEWVNQSVSDFGDSYCIYRACELV